MTTINTVTIRRPTDNAPTRVQVTDPVVEHEWLPRLGCTAWATLRLLDRHSDGTVMSTTAIAERLGLPTHKRGRTGPLMRAIQRLADNKVIGLDYPDDDQPVVTLATTIRLPKRART